MSYEERVIEYAKKHKNWKIFDHLGKKALARGEVEKALEHLQKADEAYSPTAPKGNRTYYLEVIQAITRNREKIAQALSELKKDPAVQEIAKGKPHHRIIFDEPELGKLDPTRVVA